MVIKQIVKQNCSGCYKKKNQGALKHILGKQCKLEIMDDISEDVVLTSKQEDEPELDKERTELAGRDKN